MKYSIEDWIDGEPDLGIMTLEEAEPLLDFWIDQSIGEIEYQTDVQYDKGDFELRLVDREWMFEINADEDTDKIDMEQAWEEIEDLTRVIIREIKDEQEAEIKYTAMPKAKRPK